MQYKFRERELIEELQSYIDNTYDQHYATDKYQATDIIIDSGHGTGFCLGNVIKYAKRYGNKGSPSDARKDLMKILHYAVIQLYIHDEDHKRMSVPTSVDLDHAPDKEPVYRLNDALPSEWDMVSKLAINPNGVLAKRDKSE